MKIPVKFLTFNDTAPDRGYWDQYLLSLIFGMPEFEIKDEFDFSEANSAIIVIPGRQNSENVEKINEYINKFYSVLVILTGDEESSFPVEQLKHSKMKLWLMTPHTGKSYPNVDRFIGSGITPHTEYISKVYPNKHLKWFFAGQVTHERRRECVEQLREMHDGLLVETDGFAKGMEPQDYIKAMYRSKIIPCPGGPATPDTFRFYEALESGCIPIVDEFAAYNKNEGYWQMLFGEDIPFPMIRDWKELPALINYFNDVFPQISNKIFAWWQMYKRNLYHDLIKDFYDISGIEQNREGITVIIPTSPISSNPDTSMIEETIQTVRTHLPDSEIIITFDGVRPEQEDKRENYEIFKSKVLWMCNKVWSRVAPMVFDEHSHQVAMCREALERVKTSQILYVEHDAPLTPDMAIEWNQLQLALSNHDANVIRFHFESFVPKEHEYLMVGQPQEVSGVRLLKTVQWSQRPHLADAEFYKRILKDHFSPEARTFIEDKMHGVVISAWKREQLQGWNKFKLWIYHPEGTIKRSYHLDGRGNEDKYSMKF